MRPDPVEVDLAMALAGDEDAQFRVIQGLTPVIQTRVARRLLMRHGSSPRQDVEDLTQAIFMTLFENDWKILHAWNSQKGLPLKDFVGFIATKRTISMLRGKKNDPSLERAVEDVELERPSSDPDPERRYSAKERQRILFDRFRDKLDPDEWNLFLLLFVEGLSSAEISRRTGLKPNTIDQKRRRLRKKAQDLLQELDDEGEKPDDEGEEPDAG